MVITANKNLKHLRLMIDLAKSKDSHSEQVFMVNNIKWQEYEQLLTLVKDDAGVLFRYLEGNLVIMSPSNIHEFQKENIGILLEAYFQEMNIRFYSLGSTTFRSEETLRGIEPDKSYCLNSRKKYPDLAIEVIITSGGINCLNIYKVLGVTEVWFWEKQELTVYLLQDGEYIKVNHSNLLPDLDLNLFANYITYDEPFDALLEFKDKIKNHPFY